MHYDATRAPDPATWLESDEQGRLAAVERHHAHLTAHPRTPKPRLHAALHLVVENQLALGEPPEARRALERLLAAGLDRHEAVHAIALLVSDVMTAAMEGRPFDARVYAAELDALTAERWRSLAAGK